MHQTTLGAPQRVQAAGPAQAPGALRATGLIGSGGFKLFQFKPGALTARSRGHAATLHLWAMLGWVRTVAAPHPRRAACPLPWRWGSQGGIVEYAIGIAVIVLILYLLSRRSTASQPKVRPKADHKSDTDDELGWLRERWKLADAHQQSGREDIFQKWYFDDATERQKGRLKDLGIETGRDATKGQASDLIGIHEPAEERSLAILKFFKRSTKGMNQTRARHEVAQILSDPDNAKAWESRPPTQEQKEFFKFFGLNIGKGLTAADAEKIITEHETKLAEAEDPRLDDWEAFSERACQKFCVRGIR